MTTSNCSVKPPQPSDLVTGSLQVSDDSFQKFIEKFGELPEGAAKNMTANDELMSNLKICGCKHSPLYLHLLNNKKQIFRRYLSKWGKMHPSRFFRTHKSKEPCILMRDL